MTYKKKGYHAREMVINSNQHDCCDVAVNLMIEKCQIGEVTCTRDRCGMFVYLYNIISLGFL